MTYLLPRDKASQAVASISAMAQSMPVQRVEQVGKRCMMERYHDPNTGITIERITITRRD